MINPWFIKSIIKASGSASSGGQIPLVKARTLSITVRMTFGSSIDADATVYLYYSPDGKHLDTIAYTSFDVTYSAGNTVQRTVVIDPPEHGYMSLKIVNNSSADSITDVKVWYSIQSYRDRIELVRGAITKDTGEE